MRSKAADFFEEKRQKQTERFSSGRIYTLLVISCLLLSSFFITQAGGTPVIVEDENNGSWSDHFNDSAGVSSSNNITIENEDVKLSAQGITSDINWDHEYTADLEPDAIGWSLTENAAGDIEIACWDIFLLDKYFFEVIIYHYWIY